MTRRITALFAALALLAVAAPAASAPAASAPGGNLVAPPDACPGQTKLDAPATAQERTMLCMANYARAQYGEEALVASPALEGSAHEKSRDVIRCESFSHYACGREFAYWMRAAGYLSSPCWKAGENLAWGTASLGSVRSIFRAWMRSPEHRENILGPYTETGIDLVTGTLEGLPGARIWTEHFGSHC